MFTEETLLVALLLLPGFLAAKVFNALAVRRKKTTIEFLTDVLLFEFLVVTSYAVLAATRPILRITTTSSTATDKLSHTTSLDLGANAAPFVALAGCAIAWGVILAWLHNKDYLFLLLRCVRVTKQSSHSTVWQGAFHDCQTWAIVTMASGQRIYGWPKNYSDTPEESSVFLTHAHYLDKDNKEVRIPPPGILLTKNAEIVSVQFVEG